jgi:hypothetical protein
MVYLATTFAPEMQAPLKADFNLTAPINAVLGSQDRSYNILTFHSTENGANNNTL